MRHRQLVPIFSLTLLAGLTATLAACHGTTSSATRDRTLASIRAEGNVALAQGDYDRAVGLFSTYVERWPSNPDSHFQLGRAYLGMDQPYRAWENLAVAYDLDSEGEGYLETLVEAMIQTGNTDSMFEFLGPIAEARSDVKADLLLGDAALAMGLPDEALRAYKRSVVKAGPMNPAPHRRLAEFYHDIGDSASEIERLRILLFLDPTDAGVRGQLIEFGEVPGPSLRLDPRTIDPS